MIHETLTELQYSTDLRGPLVLYTYRHDGYHTGRQYFRTKVKYPGEEIMTANAKLRVEQAEAEGKEVRITDGGDQLVYHSVAGAIQYLPPDITVERFWEMAGQ